MTEGSHIQGPFQSILRPLPGHPCSLSRGLCSPQPGLRHTASASALPPPCARHPSLLSSPCRLLFIWPDPAEESVSFFLFLFFFPEDFFVFLQAELGAPSPSSVIPEALQTSVHQVVCSTRVRPSPRKV